MWGNFEHDLEKMATSKISLFEAYAKWVSDENARRVARSTGTPEMLRPIRPAYWGSRTGHDPYHVRSKKRTIAHSVSVQLRNRTYGPHAASGYEVPKHDGSSRLVSTFEIADEVVSRRIFSSLMTKNRARLSARAYAYRNDLSPHDALDHVFSEFEGNKRIFVAEYDFSKFFDTIDHDRLLETIAKLGLRITELEQDILRKFMRSPLPRINAAGDVTPGDVERNVGIPQGTSLSLFLANVAVTPLDRKLERLGVSFARYADDTLIWSADYSAVCRAVEALHIESDNIGSSINFDKSPGVRVLADSPRAEMRSTQFIEFLGHSVSLHKLTMKTTSVSKIKARINSLIFANLLREPMNGQQNLDRLRNGLDRDFVTFISQLRRYLYGSLSESQIRSFASGATPKINFRGVMSYYPLINDGDLLHRLDEWIEMQIVLALRKRKGLLAGKVSNSAIHPWHSSRVDLRNGVKPPSAGAADLRLPSFQLIAKVLKKAVDTHGLDVVAGRVVGYNYD